MSSFQRVRGNDLATVANSAICGLLPRNNSYNINYKVTKNGNMDSFPLDPKNRYYRFKSFYHVGVRDYFIL